MAARPERAARASSRQYLDEVGDEFGPYGIPVNGSSGGMRRVEKVLVDGFWRSQFVKVDEEYDDGDRLGIRKS